MAETIQETLMLQAENAAEVAMLLPPARPRLQTGIESQGYRLVEAQRKDFAGIAAIDGGSAADIIEFKAFQSDGCVDLSRSFVSYSFTVESNVNGAWDNVFRDQPVSIRSGAGALIFDRIECSVNDTNIDDECARRGQDGAAAMSAFIHTITRKPAGYGRGGPTRAWIPVNLGGAGEHSLGAYSPTTGATAIQAYSGEFGGTVGGVDEYWRLPDEHQPTVPANHANIGENSVFPFLQARGAGNQAIVSGAASTVAVRPHSSVWQSKTALPPGTKIELSLQRARGQRFIQSQYDAADAAARISGTRVTCVDCSLWLYVIKPQEAIRAAIDAALKSERFFLPVSSHRFFSQIVPVGTLDFRYSGLFPGNVPTRIYCGFSRALAPYRLTAGQAARVSPFAMGPGTRHVADAPGGVNFNTVEDNIPAIRTIKATLNGRSYPEEMFDSQIANDSLRRYNAYRAACADSEKPMLSFAAFQRDFPVIVIDLNPSTAGVAPEGIKDDIAPLQPYSANGFDLEVTLDSAVAASEALDLAFWVIAEEPAGIQFSSGGWDGQLAAKRIGF